MLTLDTLVVRAATVVNFLVNLGTMLGQNVGVLDPEIPLLLPEL